MAVRSIGNDSVEVPNIELEKPAGEKAPPQGSGGPGPMADLSDEERTEMESFMEEVRSASEAGTLDAEALAQLAPASFAEAAEARGESVASAIEHMADQKGMPPGMAASADDSSSYEGSPSESQAALAAWESLEDGTSSTSAAVSADSLNEGLEELEVIIAQENVQDGSEKV